MPTGRRLPSPSSHPVLSFTPGSPTPQRGESIALPKKPSKLKHRLAPASKDSKTSSPKGSLMPKGRRIGEARSKAAETTATARATPKAGSSPAEIQPTQKGQPKAPDVTTAVVAQSESPEDILDDRAGLPELPALPQELQRPEKHSATTIKVAIPEAVRSPEPPPICRPPNVSTIIPPSCDATSPVSTMFYVRGPGGSLPRKAKLFTIFIVALLALFGIASLVYLATFNANKVRMNVSCFDSDEDLLVETSLGVTRGLRVETGSGHGARAFLNIPFGSDVFAERRFELATSVENLSLPFLAVEQGPACLQPLMYDIGERLPTNVSDDCLSINVYTPSGCSLDGEALPVFFFITGWMSYALSWNGMYDWRHLASRGRVIVVAPNYRLGVVGFLNRCASTNTSNLGFRDVQLAWQWTRKDIAAFGGDPCNIVPQAHASASAMMSGLLTRPKDLNVSRVVLLSQSVVAPTKNNSGLTGLARIRDVALLLGCCKGSNCSNISAAYVVHCMSRLDPLQIVSVLGLKFSMSQVDFDAEPFSLGQERLPQNTDFFQGMQRLMGSTSRDNDRMFKAWLEARNLTDAPFETMLESLFEIMGLSDIYKVWLRAHIGFDKTREQMFSKTSEIGTLVLHHCPMAHYATEAAKSGAEVRYFVLNEQWHGSGNGSRPSSSYGDDLRFLSGSVLAEEKVTADQRLLSEELMDNVAFFVRSGKVRLFSSYSSV